MLLTNAINATNSIETILVGNACLCAIELCFRSVRFVQFADWQPLHRQMKRLDSRSMSTSGSSGTGTICPGILPGGLGYAAPRRPLRSVHSHVVVS